jgi:O-antigen/teichoic acid export membrane protein
MMNSTRQIKLGAVISYLSLFINIIIGLLYTPWMIKSIGKADFGLYTLAMSVISIFVFDLGLGRAVTTFIANYLSKGLYNSINCFLGIIYKLYLSIDIIIILILSSLYFFIPDLYKGLSPEEIEKFKIIYILASCFCVFSFPFIPLTGILSAYEKFIQLKFCELFDKILRVITMTVCLISGYGLYALVLVNVVVGIITILLKLFFVKRNTDIKIVWKFWERAEFKKIFNFSLWVTIIALAQRCIFNFAPTILGIVSNSKDIAVMGVAISLEGFIFMFANALNGLFLPKVSRLVSEKKRDEISALMVKVGRIQVLIIGLLLIGFIALGESFILLWVGRDYASVYLCTILLIIPSFLHLPQEIAVTEMVVTNKVKYQAYVFVGMALLNLILAFPLSMQYGVLGMCISICIAYLARTLGLNYIFYKKMNLDMFHFYVRVYIPFLKPIVFIIPILVLLNFSMDYFNWISLFLHACIILLLYIGVIWFFYLNSNEKNVFLNLFVKIIKK